MHNQNKFRTFVKKLENMDNTQKQILRDISKRLENSTETDWTRGGIEDFKDWAKRMNTVIFTVTPILDTIANGIDEPKPSTERELLSLDDVEHMRFMYDRIIEFYGEDPNIDYMARMHRILKKLE